jgi:hypothetical protein
VAGAAVVQELVLRPVGGGADAWAWRAVDGSTYDTAAVAALCLALLEPQARGDATAD